MAGAVGGPRVLLRRLREVMAEPEAAQKRLDKIVVLIAANMVAEVCSVYLMRPTQELAKSRIWRVTSALRRARRSALTGSGT